MFPQYSILDDDVFPASILQFYTSVLPVGIGLTVIRKIFGKQKHVHDCKDSLIG